MDLDATTSSLYLSLIIVQLYLSYDIQNLQTNLYIVFNNSLINISITLDIMTL